MRKPENRSVESSCENSSDLLIRGDGDSHHPVVCEVEEGEEWDEEEPKELHHGPFETHHCVCNQRIISSLDQHKRYFTHHLNPMKTKI